MASLLLSLSPADAFPASRAYKNEILGVEELEDPAQVLDCDALFLGSPTYFVGGLHRPGDGGGNRDEAHPHVHGKVAEGLKADVAAPLGGAGAGESGKGPPPRPWRIPLCGTTGPRRKGPRRWWPATGSGTGPSGWGSISAAPPVRILPVPPGCGR